MTKKRQSKHGHCNEHGRGERAYRISKIASAIAKGNQAKAHELLAHLVDSKSVNSLHEPLKEKAHRRIAAGATLLHVAAQWADLDSIQMLLANGANVNAQDDLMRHPLHMAGAAATRAVLAAAEFNGKRVDMAACDASGCSVEHAIWMALRDEEAEEQEAEGRQGTYEDEDFVEKARRAREIYGADTDEDYEGSRPARGRRDEEEEEEEERWRARLREEGSGECLEADVSGFHAWSESVSSWEPAMGDEDGDWFTAVAAELAARNAQRAREAQERAEALARAAREARAAERRGSEPSQPPQVPHPCGRSQTREAEGATAAAERQRRADEAFRRLQQDQEQSRHVAARAAARSRYIAAWLRIQPQGGDPSHRGAATGAAAEGLLRLEDIPWPARVAPAALTSRGVPFTPEEVAAHVMDGGVTDALTRRRALQAELRRWHPDKFEARYGKRLEDSEREAVLLLVKSVSQCLNELYAGG